MPIPVGSPRSRLWAKLPITLTPSAASPGSSPSCTYFARLPRGPLIGTRSGMVARPRSTRAPRPTPPRWRPTSEDRLDVRPRQDQHDERPIVSRRPAASSQQPAAITRTPVPAAPQPAPGRPARSARSACTRPGGGSCRPARHEQHRGRTRAAMIWVSWPAPLGISSVRWPRRAAESASRRRRSGSSGTGWCSPMNPASSSSPRRSETSSRIASTPSNRRWSWSWLDERTSIVKVTCDGTMLTAPGLAAMLTTVSTAGRPRPAAKSSGGGSSRPRRPSGRPAGPSAWRRRGPGGPYRDAEVALAGDRGHHPSG